MATQVQLTNKQQLIQILSSKKLSKQQLNWLATVLLPLLQNKFGEDKIKNISQVLSLIRQNPDIALSLFSSIQDTGTGVEGARLAFLIQEMEQDQEKIAKALKQIYPNLSKTEIYNLETIINTLKTQETLKKIAKKPQLKDKLTHAHQKDYPKPGSNPAKNIQEFSKRITQAVITDNDLDLTPIQTRNIEEKVTQVLIASPKDITTKEAVLMATVVAVTNTPPQVAQQITEHSPIAEIALELNQNIQGTTPQDYQNLTTPPSRVLIINQQQKINLPDSDKLPTETEIKTNLDRIIKAAIINQLNNTEPGKDLKELVKKEKTSLQKKATVNPHLSDTIEEIEPPIINQQNFNEFLHIARGIAPTQIRPTPTGNAAHAAGILETADPHSEISPQAIEATGLGISLQVFAQIQQMALDHPQSKMAKFIKKNPLFFPELAKQLQTIEQTQPIPADIPSNTPPQPSTYDQLRPHPNIFTPIFRQINSLSNRIISFLPQKLAKPLNAIFHPFQTLKSWAFRKAGKKIGKRLLKKGFLKIGEKLLKKGLVWLGKQSLSKGATVALNALGIATGPGIIVTAALTIAMKVGELAYKYLIKPFIGLFKNIAESIWGKTKKEDLLAIPLAGVSAVGAAFTAIPGILAVAGSVAFAATTAAGVTIIIASGITLIFYLAAFNMGPIIAGMAQLGMPITGGIPGLTIMTGPATSGREAVVDENIDLTQPGNTHIPFGDPTDNYDSIAQEAHEGTHTIAWGFTIDGETFQSEGEAIDYMMDSGTPIQATHDGIAYFFAENTPGRVGLGNHVIVISEYNGQKFATIYAHLQITAGEPGSSRPVKRGYTIGSSGASGSLGDSPHLHYEIIGLGDIQRYR